MSTYQPNILVYHPKSLEVEAYTHCIQKFGYKSVRKATTVEEAETYLSDTDVILGWKFPTSILNQPIASNVQWFQSMGAGVDDLVADKSIPERIQLTRIVDQFGTYISEYVFTYLLHIVKDVPRMAKAQTEQSWDPFIAESLAGKTIGVAGLGSIGKEIVRKARAFDMKVYGLSFSGNQAHLTDSHFLPDQWVEFVKDLDYLVLTLPLTENTHHVINEELLLTMKEGASIVNVGRGALINEEDLVSVMKSGHLDVAVLDVFEKEPLTKDHPFWSMPNVYVTSHLSGPSTINGVCSFFAENLNRFITEQPLQGLVDRKRGY